VNKKDHKLRPALKHGGYSGTTLLPGEDASAFEKLLKDLVSEFAPAGPLERDIVADFARLIWRKQNLSTYRLAKLATERVSAIRRELIPRTELELSLSKYDTRDPEEIRAAQEAADNQARKELGSAWELVEMDDEVTFDHLLRELELMDRLDGMIDRCIKRLLMVRGLKSISSSASTAPSGPKRIAAA